MTAPTDRSTRPSVWALWCTITGAAAAAHLFTTLVMAQRLAAEPGSIGAPWMNVLCLVLAIMMPLTGIVLAVTDMARGHGHPGSARSRRRCTAAVVLGALCLFYTFQVLPSQASAVAYTHLQFQWEVHGNGDEGPCQHQPGSDGK